MARGTQMADVSAKVIVVITAKALAKAIMNANGKRLLAIGEEPIFQAKLYPVS
jgi:hypothetical protein